MSATPAKRDVNRLARRIHKCPKGYDGPCWGPTDEDREIARFRLTEVLNCPTPENHSSCGSRRGRDPRLGTIPDVSQVARQPKGNQ